MFRLDMRQEGMVPVWALFGELDAVTVGAFDAEVEAWAHRLTETLVVDLTGLTYLNSRGIAALIRLEKVLRDAGHGMRLRGASPRFDRLFRFCGLDRTFEFEGQAAQVAE